MGTGDWFRKLTWAEADKKEFFAKLEESDNPYHKAQYLRIQALHLQDIGSIPKYSAALELLDLLLEKWPHKSQLALAYLQKAECLAALGQVGKAIESYRASLDAERSNPKSATKILLSYGMFAVTGELTDLYDEVLAIMEEFTNINLELPQDEYKYHAIRSLIAENKGDIEEARKQAKLAIEAAQKVYSATLYDRANLAYSARPDTGVHKKIHDLACQ